MGSVNRVQNESCIFQYEFKLKHVATLYQQLHCDNVHV